MTLLPLIRHLLAAGVAAFGLAALSISSPASSNLETQSGSAAWNVTKNTVGYVKRKYSKRRKVRSGYHWHSNADYREVTTPVSHFSTRRFRGFGRRGDGYRTSGKYN